MERTQVFFEFDLNEYSELATLLALPVDPVDEELARDWTLSEADKAEVRRCRGDTNRRRFESFGALVGI